LNVPPISVSGGSGTNFCQGQNVTLNTTTQTGQNISYQWYLDAPVPVLLATTSLNVYTIPSPPPGTYRYFVKVKIGECLTPNSFVITVNVFARPQAIVEDDKIIICAGEPLAFGTAISGPGLTYQWSGPGWAGSTAQFPLVSSSAAAAQAGIHTLKTFQNGCESIPPDTVEVIVKYTPPKPQINGQSAVCVGDTVVLIATVGGAPPPDRFEWQDSLQNIIVIDNVNSLTLPNVNTTNCGNWRVRAGYQNCFSEWSDPFYFCPQQYPVVTASANNPICQDSTLRLQASGSLGNLNWCWTLPNTNQIFLQNPVLTPGQPGIYQVVGKTTSGCADTAFVTVVGGLAPLIDTIIVNAPVCADGSIASLIPTISSVNAPFTYTWRNGQGVAISTDLTLLFPAVPANNGPYTFVVKDTFGCPSAPETVTVSVQAQVTTPVLQVTPNPICAGGTVQVQLTNSGSYTALSTFHWINPAGDTIDTSTPFLTLNNVQVTQSGAYRVFVSEGVCASPNSNVVNLVVNAIPETPAPVSNQPVCVGEQLVFDANDIPGATYFWTGPNGFFDSIQNPVRNNAIPGFEGIYTLRVRVNGCFSALATHVVDIMSVPKTPIIVPSSPSPVCLEQLPIPGFLHVSEASQTFGAIYTWIDPATGDTIPNPSPLTQDLYYATLPPALLTPGWHTFQVIAWDEDNPNGQGCSSALSNIVSVRFDTIPDNQATAAEDHPACSSQPVVLQAVKPSGNVTGQWSWISGGPMEVPITNRDSATALFAGVPNTTYTFVWSISSGACKNFSVDTLVIEVVAPEKAEGSLGLDTTFLCPGTDFALNAQQGQYTTGIWSQLNQFGITIADPLEPASPVSGFIPGNAYYFVWTLADIGCGASADTIAVFCYSVKPNILAAPFACTGENCVHAEAQPLAFFETGVWTANPSSVVFTPPNSVSTEACGLIPGLNTLYLTINNGVCGQNSRDTTTVVYEIFPQANADVVATEFGSPVTFQVLTNDILPMEPPSCTIIIPPTNGTIIGNPSNGSFIYRPNSGFSGADVLTYKICNIRCGENACSSATVTINVGAAGECAVPTVITPNGDTRNETFRLPPECYRSGEGQDAIIEVTIFNQWGDYVYHKKPFLQDVDYWDGRVNNTGPVLPSGTYYFVVKIEGEAKARTGFIQLQTVRD
jgi:gliding motility-associated-like protein